MDYIKLAILELEKRSGISAGMARDQYATMQKRITALETAGRDLLLATNYDQERRRNIPGVIYKLIMKFAALLDRGE